METLPLEVYSSASNFAVIKPPGRRFPGSVIQGDTLFHLCDLARQIFVAIRSGRVDGETDDTAAELVQHLAARLLHYQEALEHHGLELPSPARRTTADFAFADVTPDMPVEGWIYRSNLRSFMESLSWLVAYSFDEDDWTAIRLGVANADAEGERWYEYSLHGGDPGTPMSLQLAPDAGSSIVHVKALVHPSLVRAVDQSVAIFQHVRNSDPVESARPENRG